MARAEGRPRNVFPVTTKMHTVPDFKDEPLNSLWDSPCVQSSVSLYSFSVHLSGCRGQNRTDNRDAYETP